MFSACLSTTIVVRFDMGYSDGHPLRLDGGRLILDFLNTADWSETGDVVHEKLECLEDVRLWMKAVGLSGYGSPETVKELTQFRSDLRPAFLTGQRTLLATHVINSTIKEISGDVLSQSISGAKQSYPPASLVEMIALSAASILSDVREKNRLRICPGARCGWLFLDETKNARRKWCSMEACGNREKARRNYERSKAASA